MEGGNWCREESFSWNAPAGSLAFTSRCRIETSNCDSCQSQHQENLDHRVGLCKDRWTMTGHKNVLVTTDAQLPGGGFFSCRESQLYVSVFWLTLGGQPTYGAQGRTVFPVVLSCQRVKTKFTSGCEIGWCSPEMGCTALLTVTLITLGLEFCSSPSASPGPFVGCQNVRVWRHFPAYYCSRVYVRERLASSAFAFQGYGVPMTGPGCGAPEKGYTASASSCAILCFHKELHSAAGLPFLLRSQEEIQLRCLLEPILSCALRGAFSGERLLLALEKNLTSQNILGNPPVLDGYK